MHPQVHVEREQRQRADHHPPNVDVELRDLLEASVSRSQTSVRDAAPAANKEGGLRGLLAVVGEPGAEEAVRDGEQGDDDIVEDEPLGLHNHRRA